MDISVQDYARERAEQGLRGDYLACLRDFTVEQAYDYDDAQQRVWRLLCDRQTELTSRLAHRSYLDGVEALGLLEQIPARTGERQAARPYGLVAGGRTRSHSG